MPLTHYNTVSPDIVKGEEMRQTFIYFIAVALMCVGCAKNCKDTTLYQKSGRAKPIVAVMPVINTSNANSYSWDISHELTEEIRSRIFDSSRLYLLKEGGSMQTATALNIPDPSALSMEAKESLGAAEFVVVTELLDQHETPYGLNSDRPFLGEIGSVLALSMRVRVLDVRGETPKVILQEIVNQEHTISRPYLKTDYNKTPWGTEAFDRTPLGLAHGKLVREVVGRVEGYVGARKG